MRTLPAARVPLFHCSDQRDRTPHENNVISSSDRQRRGWIISSTLHYALVPVSGERLTALICPLHRFITCSITHVPQPGETMTNEPRDQRPEIRLSQLSHGAG
jgi:hypothetical protein